MKPIFLFDIKSYFVKWSFHAFLLLIISFGIFGGANAHFSVSENVFQNSPYQISFITIFISLTGIFFSTLFASQLLFRESDARFELILFSTPIKKIHFISGRYAALLTLSFLCFLLLTVSFFIGQSLSRSSGEITSFSFFYYAYPVVIFGGINILFVTSFLCFIAWLTKNKMLVYVSGLLLYILYMVTLVYSGSPLMAQSLPQSEQARFISAITDPFGFSAFFYQTTTFDVAQKNSQLVSLHGILLLNRLIVTALSAILFFIAARKFTFVKTARQKKIKTGRPSPENISIPAFAKVTTTDTFNSKIKALLSFTKIDLIYIVKSIPFILTSIVLLFATGMEMFAEIEKGIRIPQQYVSSGLMASTIIQTFYGLCTIVVLYYAYEIFWRSKNVNFFLIENSTAHSNCSFFARWLSLAMVILFFSLLMIAEGIVFQFLYDYPKIDWTVYSAVLLLCTLPLILLGGWLLLLQKVINKKYIGLGCIVIFALLMATSFGKKLITFPLLKFLQTINFDYSDMNGFGIYLKAVEWRLIFGIGVTAIFAWFSFLSVKRLKRWAYLLQFLLPATLSFYAAAKLLDGYTPKNFQAELQAQANYEKNYRTYEGIPQPTITDIVTSVDLFPENNAYEIKAVYFLENKSGQPIDRLLINFSDGFKIKKAILLTGEETIAVTNQYQPVELHRSVLPGGKLKFEFEISYSWKAVNGHQSFNAIIKNGSFMRISRYYPQFGYLKNNEITDVSARQYYQLGKVSPEKPFDAPKEKNDEFINLDMTISTSASQTAIGVGELMRQWTTGNRSYFQYKTSSPIPFRFALSSAIYAVKKETYNGRELEIYYHPGHFENVDHLLANAKITLDYCEANFGPYPFKTVRFAEVSSFTRGFAATAYPTTIFMTENMLFHANIKSDQQQDVINELAGHELSHLWWGCNQVVPDQREGAAMLTETFAMYTEMMLLKKMYGKEKMLQRLKMHEGIYKDERGFTPEEPLYKVKDEDSYISYSKGAIVMCRLSELIGEKTVNLALSRFLEKNKYPHDKPVSVDFLQELFLLTDKKIHPEIERLFMTTGDPDEKLLR